MAQQKNTIQQLSPHLFWDVDINTISPELSKKMIVERVLNYGLMKDWNWIVRTYGIHDLLNTAIQLKNLSERSANFLSTIYDIEKEKFACYKNNRSARNFLNY